MDTQRNLRLAGAALASGVNAKTVRNWTGDGIKLASAPPESGQRCYAFLDVAILGLMRRLVDFGLGVSSANDLAYQALCKLDPTVGTEAAARSGALVQAWRDHRLQIDCLSDDLYGLQRVDLRKTFAMPTGPMTAPQFFALARRDIEPKAAAWLTIDVAALLEAAFSRATEILESQAVADGVVEDFASQLTAAFAERNAAND